MSADPALGRRFPVERGSVKQLAKRLLGPWAPALERPLFILSAPRSGSSHFHSCLRRLPELWAFERENDVLWWRFFPYARTAVPSDYVGRDDLTETDRDRFRAELALALLRRHPDPKQALGCFLRREPLRYLEKTIANCFHLDALDALFPDARFVHLVRDGRACISSMLEGWSSGRFWKRPLPLPVDASITHWCYPIPPGWQSVASLPLEQICAWSWVQHHRHVLDRIRSHPGFRSRVLRVEYESFLANPQAVLRQVAAFSELEVSERALEQARRSELSWTTVSEPAPEKWRDKNGAAIDRVMPRIAPLMGELGYRI